MPAIEVLNDLFISNVLLFDRGHSRKLPSQKEIHACAAPRQAPTTLFIYDRLDLHVISPPNLSTSIHPPLFEPPLAFLNHPSSSTNTHCSLFSSQSIPLGGRPLGFVDFGFGLGIESGSVLGSHFCSFRFQIIPLGARPRGCLPLGVDFGADFLPFFCEEGVLAFWKKPCDTSDTSSCCET